ncbi:hypothetical protein FJ987_09865 [Mesorhizobium sp. CU2]|uniref:hypothetical protein n=1 Tax=unclassified Mesorhizobium TaxID=325217 RepID=UPI00112AF233|nr:MULTISPECIES: hypothetical protein [unclassified Mesorhizobium]TPN81137.1 hypothetical protein FJ988_19830 [Mesorhizobium sp. CU3]TPO17064.1 hypothetical protein FJ987_09865 [Mesorhizobium sp. CU2]
MKVETIFLKPTPTVPNSRLPVLIYRGIISGSIANFEATIRANGWFPDWYSKMGLYPKHHFHSDAHELIGFASGAQTGRLGGDGGVDVELEKGDVVVIPAGVGHLGIGISDDILAIGAYPLGYGIRDFRLCEASEFAEAFRKVQQVPVPPTDPFLGATGPLPEIWMNAAA